MHGAPGVGDDGGVSLDNPAWVTVALWSPTVMAPVRCSLELFGAIRNRTVPSPFPLAAVVTVIQPAFDTAFQAQPPGADTRTSRVSPAEGLVKPSLQVQDEAAIRAQNLE